ncbi:MAG: ATP-dependent DNA ligase [Paracoccaceae bacterium]
MKRFAQLFTALDQTTRTSVKVAALAEYFRDACDDDKLWTIALLSGRRPKRGVTTTLLREWAAEKAGIPLWLFEESYAIVGDLAETIALVLPPPEHRDARALADWMAVLRELGAMDIPEKKSRVLAAWDSLDPIERFVFNKLITGGFRVGVSQKLMTRGLSGATGIEEPELAHRIMGDWNPHSTTYADLILAENPTADASKPYPFYLAHQLGAAEDLGTQRDWRAEYKWDGIRGQLILRDNRLFLWSRGEELITEKFPELAVLTEHLPGGTVIDGELLAWRDEAPLPFNALQKRLGRKTVPKKLLAEAPVILKAYDLLEWQGRDLRTQAYDMRRAQLSGMLQTLPASAPLRLSANLPFESFDDLAALRAAARARRAEGLMLKRGTSPYLAGRKKGDWWKWKVDPLVIDAVMIYAQSGHGRRANLFTDFTFAVWNGNDLVPFTKAYSGLTDAEFRKITAWVRKNTQERYGPVRAVTPHHVFEIAFEGIQESTRHKSGVALRFPRMSRWRQDKPVQEANTLEDLKDMLAQFG